VLAQFCEPPFFQRLRVEQQIGYVVSCRYQRVADRDGLLMALQSPDRRAGELLRCCKTFLRQLDPWMRRPSGRYSSGWPLRPPVPPRRAPGRAANGLPGVTPQAADALRVEEVVALWREMTRRRRRWRVLFTTGS
jgi:hypothetical protein